MTYEYFTEKLLLYLKPRPWLGSFQQCDQYIGYFESMRKGLLLVQINISVAVISLTLDGIKSIP